DASTFEIWGALLNGARLVIMPSQRAALEDLADTLIRERITTLWLTASLFHLMVDQHLDALMQLRQLLAGGDVLSVAHVKKFLAAAPACRLINGYGPTENTTFTCCYSIPHDANIVASVPIGRPIANTHVFIVDPHLNPVPIGIPGELHIGGVGLARGYLDRPELTKEKFIPNPFSEDPDSRLYKTGDLARYLADGNIEFLGRIDTQVKIRGFRIELGEIEAALNRHPAVKACAVIAREDTPGDKRLVAYVVVAEESAPANAMLRDYLKQSLPDYMLPSAFVVLDQLPLTPNGKLDRKALPAPEYRSEESFVAPRTPTEDKLAAIWGQVLKLDRVGIHDNFFELGGDSILSIRIIALAHQAGLKLTPRQLFQHQTIAELATAAEIVPIGRSEQGPVTGPVPLTPIQQWFFESDEPDLHHFNMAMVLELREAVDSGRLQTALRHLLEHHDALRLRFIYRDGAWHQRIADVGEPAPFSRCDLAALPAAEQAAVFDRIAEQTQASLNLTDGPLLRIVLFDFGTARRARLLIIVHHLAIDGVSWRILLDDLDSAYRQLSRADAVTLPAKTTSFKDWAHRLTEHAQSAAVRRELDYWLAGSGQQLSRLPLDFPAGVSTQASARVSVALSIEETQALLTEVPAAYHTQINDVLLAALAQGFAEWTGSHALLIDLEGHGREELAEDLDPSRTVGWFTTQFPVHLALQRASAADNLKSIKEQLRQIPNRGIGFGLLRYLGADKRIVGQLEKLPHAEVSFNYLGQFDQALPESSPFQLVWESSGPTSSPRRRRSHLLSVNGLIAEGRLQLTWTYSENLHRRATIAKLSQGFKRALRALIAHCRSPEAGGYTPSDFPLAGLDQRTLDRLVAEDRDLEDIYPLSPMQEGMLFHTLYAPASSMYLNQSIDTIEGELNVAAYEEAWRAVVKRHPVLRSAFIWKNLERPLQVVRANVTVALAQQDWRELSPLEQEEQLALFIETDQKRGVELGTAPLLRLALIRVADHRYHFIWSCHHLLQDRWSLATVFDEVYAHYAARRQGQQPAFAPGGRYRDYIAWIEAQDKSQAETFWRNSLAGFKAPTPLTVERSGARDHDYIKLQLELAPRLMTALSSFARRHQLTLNTLAQGAWALLLSRYSAADDVVFGVTSSGRPGSLAGVESMVGPFINTLPARVSVPPGAALLPWLKQLQARQIEVRQYEYCSLVEIQGWSEVPRGVPLFETILVFENIPLESTELARTGLTIRKGHSVTERTGYALVIAVIPGSETRGPTVAVTYNTDLFDFATITRLVGHYETLLESIVADPEQRLSALSMVTAAERHQLLVEWNNTAADYPKHRCIHQLFVAQADATPDAVAVVFEDQQLSYAQLNRKANRLAHHLIALGVGPDVLAAVCVERSLAMVVALLGILKAGGAYVPLDPAYPKERLAFMLADSKAPVLIIQRNNLKDTLLPEHDAHCVFIDQAEAFDRYPITNPETNVAPDHLAYVIYTSGSTGKPKGVLIAHRGLCNVAEAQLKIFDAQAHHRILQFASLSFDAAIFEIAMAWRSGAALYLTAPDAVLAGSALIEQFRAQAITHATLPPSVLAVLSAEALPALQIVVCAGEACSADIVARWAPGRRFFNAYGPTEATIWSTVAECHDDGRKPLIGRPIANTQLYILDPHLNPVPIGVPGELCIGGAGLARGYLNRPELTAENFIANPFGAGRLYKTGDLARYLPDGNIEFLGRLDTQVKVRGFRIELGEIETVLNQHPGVKACAVLAREDAPGDKRLVAYVVSHKAPVPGKLREFLREKLPEYMLPTSFITLDHLPLTPNGKLDRKALPAPEDSRRPDLDALYVAPRTPTEETLAAIWAEVLKLDQVGIHDNFFDLGGHSLLAVQLISRVREQLDVDLPLRAIFEAPTVAALSAVVAKTEKVERGLAPIPRRASTGSAPLSFAQQRLWFLDQLEPTSTAYHMPVMLRLRGVLNVLALKASLSEIVRRHEVLRTTFATAGNEPVQVIHPPQELDLPVIDLAHLASHAREAEAMHLASDEAERPFSLSSGPLFRARLLKLDDHQHLLVLAVHHIVSDGWSMGILSRELSALYRAHVDARPSPLGDIPIQYADYAVWQRRWFEEGESQRQLSYWKKQLDRAPAVSELVTDYPRPAVQSYRGANQSLTLSIELTADLKRLSRRENLTLFMTLLAAFKTLLYRYSGQQDLLIGTHIAGRHRHETESLIGFFIGTLALRTDLSGNPSFRQLLIRVRETALGAYAHQDVPFERLVEELRPERSVSHTPFVQVVFNMLNLPDSGIELQGLMAERVPGVGVGSKFDLTLYAREQDEGLDFTAVYAKDLFNAATITRLLRHFETLLQGIVADPDCRLSQLPVLTDAEAVTQRNHIRPRQAFIEFSAEAIEQSIVQRFEQQVGICANHVAVKTRTHEWSYAELNRAANRAAHALLRSRGSGAEQVALLLDHDAPMIAAVLGVLKSGKSYVPLDPAYPRQRLACMLADTRVLLTNSANLALAKSLNHLQLFNIDALDSPVSNVEVPVSPDAIAYTLHTSGSTGQPKGVTQNHRNVLHFIRAYTNNLHISANDRLTLFSAYGFDAAVQDIFAALLNGAALYPVNLKEESLDDLTQWLIENEITLFHSTPSTYRYFVRALSGHESFPALRLVVLGGEAVYKHDIVAYQKHFSPDCLFVNGFGLTESTVNLHYFADRHTKISRNGVPIGYPVENTEVLLLDEAGDSTELYGEIGIRSAHLALGYLNQPELSKQRFLADPNDPARRIYRTGDMARQRADGSLEFAGRKDHQVKLRGYRIELREIEAALAEHPAVRECAVTLGGDEDDRRLIAYVVSHHDAGELRAFLKARLPDYMIPSTFVALDRLPMTSSGKISYRELPIPDDAHASVGLAFVAPRTPNERTLAGIFAAVLKLEKVGIHDNFFDLGGHSLLATQVISRVRKAFNLDIPLRAMFESPTVAGMSALILRKQAEALSDDELAQLLTEAQR
ncbi:MAG: amino acid adenylation domain-containing protein, partial [Chromatiales bacterium]